jgi:hypothetical protein
MKYLQYLIPPFLRKIDHYLLQRYPVLWETKIAYVLFYSVVVANLALLGVGFFVPVSQSYVPDYETFTSNVLVWTGILVFLALGYYTYLQSFIRIRVYTLRENLLRVGLYAVAVLSILSNMLVLPNTVAYRVRSLYSAEQLKKDREEILKASLIKEFVRASFYKKVQYSDEQRTDAEREARSARKAEVLAYLKKSPLNRQGAVDSYLRDIDFLENIAKKSVSAILTREDIENKHDWHPALRFEMTYRNHSESEAVREDDYHYKNYSYELNLPHIAKLYATYPPLSLKKTEYRYYYNFHVYENLQNIERYHQANMFLQRRFGYRPEEMYHEHENKHDLERFVISSQTISQDLRNFLDNRLRSNIDHFESNEVAHWKTCIDVLASPSKLDAFAKNSVPLTAKTPVTLAVPYFVLVLGLALLVLVSKAFTFRTLFISAVGIIATILSVGFSLAWLFYQFPFLSDYFTLYNYSYGYKEYSRMTRFMWAFGHILLTIVVMAGIFGSYVLRYHLHKKWFETLWVYFINGSFVATFFWFVFGLFNGLEHRDAHTFVYDNGVYALIYLVFATCIFAMYSIYNKMMGLPLKR